MKNKIILFAVSAMLLAGFTTLAQENDQIKEKKEHKKHARSFIELSGGVSAPLGNYAKTDYSNNASGFAGLGPVFTLTGVGYIKHSNFGLGGTLSYSYYNVKGGNNLAAGYQNDFDVDSTNVHVTQYKSIQLLVGPYYSIPLGIATIDFHAISGINCMYSPRIDVLVEDGGNSYTNGGTAYSFWQESAFSAVLAAQLGVGVRVEPVKHFAISARLNYFYSRPVFNLKNDYRTANTGRLINSYSEPFYGLNATLGMAYVFGK